MEVHSRRTLKPCLEDFEHYFVSVWDECNCAVAGTFFATAFLMNWNENFTEMLSTFSMDINVLISCMMLCLTIRSKHYLKKKREKKFKFWKDMICQNLENSEISVGNSENNKKTIKNYFVYESECRRNTLRNNAL